MSGAAVHPGDIVSRTMTESWLCLQQSRSASPIRRKLAAGVLGLDTYGMREPLERAGLRFVD